MYSTQNLPRSTGKGHTLTGSDYCSTPDRDSPLTLRHSCSLIITHRPRGPRTVHRVAASSAGARASTVQLTRSWRHGAEQQSLLGPCASTVPGSLALPEFLLPWRSPQQRKFSASSFLGGTGVGRRVGPDLECVRRRLRCARLRKFRDRRENCSHPIDIDNVVDDLPAFKSSLDTVHNGLSKGL